MRGSLAVSVSEVQSCCLGYLLGRCYGECHLDVVNGLRYNLCKVTKSMWQVLGIGIMC